MKAALALAFLCPWFSSVRNGPPTAQLLSAGEQPKNAHPFVVERWTSVAPPKAAFTLKSGSSSVGVEDHPIDFVGRARLHELVPEHELSPGTWTVEWSADKASDRFTFVVVDETDAAPPVLEATSARSIDNPPDPKCDLWQAWRSASIPAAKDEFASVYLVWRADDDGLVDLALPPTLAVSGGGKDVDLGPVGDEWIGVAAIDAAGRRTAPRELPIGTPRSDPRTRPLRLVTKHVSTWIVEHPWESGGALFAILVIVSAGFHRSKKRA